VGVTLSLIFVLILTLGAPLVLWLLVKLSALARSQFFSMILFLPTPFNWDGRHLFALAMAYNFTVAWLFFLNKTIVFSLWIKLPSLPGVNFMKLFLTKPNSAKFIFVGS
jgi:hypothetical protein